MILAIDEEMCVVGSTVDILYTQRIIYIHRSMTDLEKIHYGLSKTFHSFTGYRYKLRPHTIDCGFNKYRYIIYLRVCP